MSVDVRLFGLVLRLQLAVFCDSPQQVATTVYDSALIRVLRWSGHHP
jgi:hypothetical protein